MGLRKALQSPDLEGLFKDREAFVGRLRKALQQARVALKAPQFKKLLAALAERDPTAEVCKAAKGSPEPDPDLRDYENIPLDESVEAYIARVVLPHVHEAWVDEEKSKVGYEVPFTRLFYEPAAVRPVEDIEADILALEAEIQKLLKRAVQ